MPKKMIFWSMFMFLLTGNLYAQNTLKIRDAHLVLEFNNNSTGLENFTKDELEDMGQTILDSIITNCSFFVRVAVYISYPKALLRRDIASLKDKDELG